MKERENYVMVTTVEGRKEHYSDRDARRAKAACKLQNIMMYHGTKELLKMIDRNAIKNCGVTRRDILMAEDIFGVNTNIVKGKKQFERRLHICGRTTYRPCPLRF